jgi:hypothetical protein
MVAHLSSFITHSDLANISWHAFLRFRASSKVMLFVSLDFTGGCFPTSTVSPRNSERALSASAWVMRPEFRSALICDWSVYFIVFLSK